LHAPRAWLERPPAQRLAFGTIILTLAKRSTGVTDVTEPLWSKGPPRKILLATDLSSRCDRALDKSVELAKRWNAQLHVLHVLERDTADWEHSPPVDVPSWRRPPDRERVVEQQIRHDVSEEIGTFFVHVEDGTDGEPAEVIERVARAQGCELIVTGVARDETFGRYFLGTTVNKIVRRSAIPVLVVKRRSHRYTRIVVATDFSDSSVHALNATAAYFPDVPLTLLHGFEISFSGFLDRSDFREHLQAIEREAATEFLGRSSLTDAQRLRVSVLVEHGAPETMIRAYMQDKDVPLVVIGTHGRSAAFDILIGSVARRILESAPGDVLLVREPKAVKA
jgi:nucleotide-binding universal stress UspA family protein